MGSRTFSVLFLVLGLRILVFAAAPTLDQLYPPAIQAGTSNVIQAVGKFDPWPPKMWTDVPGLIWSPQTNNGKFAVQIPYNAPIGPHLVRAYNESGSSELRFLVVTSEPQVPDTEPNNDYKKPQVVTNIPASLYGRLENSTDVDSFAVRLEAGETLNARIDSYVLAAPLDTVLRIVDTNGQQHAFNHDNTINLDAALTFKAPRESIYVLQVFGFSHPATSEIRFAGGNNCIYRLFLSTVEPKPTSARTAGTEVSEEQLASAEGANALLPIPCTVSGCISKAGEEDVYSFTAKKGESLLFEVESAVLGYPLDARLKVTNPKGEEVGKGDDTSTVDPAAEFTAGSDNTFKVHLTSVIQRGGSDYRYRLHVFPLKPSIEPTVASHSFTIEPGKTNELKVALGRKYGHKGKLNISAKALPEGVHIADVEAAENAKDANLKLIAEPGAKPASGPFSIVVNEKDKDIPVIFGLTSTSVNNGVPGGYKQLLIDKTDLLWLTVLKKPEQKKPK